MVKITKFRKEVHGRFGKFVPVELEERRRHGRARKGSPRDKKGKKG